LVNSLPDGVRTEALAWVRFAKGSGLSAGLVGLGKSQRDHTKDYQNV